jgi:hypothetical protein
MESIVDRCETELLSQLARQLDGVVRENRVDAHSNTTSPMITFQSGHCFTGDENAFASGMDSLDLSWRW